MRLLAAVALGGALGSAARWLVAGWVQQRAESVGGPVALFPAGTLAVNLIGCFAVGLLAALFEERLVAGVEWRAFVLIGVLGGFTTFSTFGFETVALVRAGSLLLAAANALGSVALGLVGVVLGLALARVL
jgi:CrcB protein